MDIFLFRALCPGADAEYSAFYEQSYGDYYSQQCHHSTH